MKATPEFLHGVAGIGLVLAAILGAVAAWLRFRGRRFGMSDLLIFGAFAIAADVLCYKLFHAVSGPHMDSAAYGALAAMLALFGLAPVAAGLNFVAIAALIVCLVRHPPLRYWVVAVSVAGWLVYAYLGSPGDMAAPGGALNNDRVAGENWALESGASTRSDCDRQSRAQAFREGCYSRLKR